MNPLARYYAGLFWRALALAALVAPVALAAWSLCDHLPESRLPLPPGFGNFERVVKKLTDKPAPGTIRFAVVGDTRGFGTFEAITDMLKQESLDFLVLLGDCTNRPFDGDHRWFRAEIATEMATSYPTFYVPGNHDIREGTFGLAQWERTYGPSQFHFLWGDSLFIFLRVLPKKHPGSSTEPALRLLREALREHRDAARRVFVFQHTPLPVSKEHAFKAIDRPGELLALFDEFKVDYVFAGDWHGYTRVCRKGTTYLVTGGGGGRLHARKWGEFHHALRLTVGPEGVSEDILRVPRVRDLEDKVEYYAIARVRPWVSAHPVLSGLLAAAWLACTVAVLIHLWRYGRSRRPKAEAKPQVLA